MSDGHCAWCDSLLGGTSRETVDHLRPKSTFPQYAFEWANLFPACDFCQGFRRERFDDRLLHPDEDGFEFGRFFLFDVLTGDISVHPGASAEDQARARETIRLFGLNEGTRPEQRLGEWEVIRGGVERKGRRSYRFVV